MDDRYVINGGTGTVLTTLEEGDRILRKSSIDAFKEQNKGESFPELMELSFSKVNTKEGQLLSKELSQAEKAVLFSLLFYVSYTSGLIMYENGRDMGFEDIVQITGMSRTTTKMALDLLIEKSVLCKCRSGKGVQYYMNPWVACKGAKFNPTLKAMFKRYRIRSKGNVMWKDLAE